LKIASDNESAGAVGGIPGRYAAAAGTIFHASRLSRANQGERPALAARPLFSAAAAQSVAR